MPKVKSKKGRNTFRYNVDRKKLKRRSKRKAAPRIECSHIRRAWDDKKTVAQNLAEMGLAVDPNKVTGIQEQKASEMEVDRTEAANKFIRKPYVIRELEAAASLPEKKTTTLSEDMIQYVRYMIENYGENYKKMARDEKNYYQDTPKQIRRKIELYKRYHPDEYKELLQSMKDVKMDVR
ncbi:nucleolar protein 16 [Protopterus annectens]|uniref:nucleolar protein 16 n=1 Tax=Protopterus annectens TaxID=7888 RepID=UPI001CF94327|nr:nucleolar protein 16 [Protopterus annectens]